MIVGLDIGARRIKAAVLAGSRRRARLVKFVVREVPDGGPEDLSAAIDALFREERLPRDRVYTSVRTQDAILREVTVPFSQPDAIRRTIKFEAEDAFHGVTVENMLIDFYRISTIGEKSRLLVVGVQKKSMGNLLGVLNEAGIDPPHMGLDLGGLFNAAAWQGVLPEEGASVIIDVGMSSVRLVVADGRQLRAARTIRLQASPALPPPKDPAVPPGVVLSEEEEAKLGEEADEESPAKPDDRAIARVVAEVSRTIVGSHLQAPLAGILATGGGPGRAAIVRRLEEKLSVRARDLDPGGALGAPGRGPSDLGAAAIGMALIGLGLDHVGIDFRQEEFRYQRAFERARWGIATAVSVLFLMLFLLTWTFQERIRRNEMRVEIVRKSQQELVGIMFTEPLSGTDSWAIIQKKKNQLVKRFEGKNTEIRSTLRDFRTVSEAFTGSEANLEFTKMRLRQDSSVLEGEAGSSEEVYKFRDDLKGRASGMEIASPKIEAMEGGRVRFTINIDHLEG